MEGSMQCRRRRCDGGIRVHMRTSDIPHRRSAAIQFVVGMEDEQYLQRAFEDRVRFIFYCADPEHHVQEVAREAQSVVRIDIRHAYTVAVGERGDRRGLWR